MIDSIKCSFCGASVKDVEKLIKAPEKDVFICDGCIEISMILILQAKHSIKKIET